MVIDHLGKKEWDEEGLETVLQKLCSFYIL
jgi:hypothetical protein